MEEQLFYCYWGDDGRSRLSECWLLELLGCLCHSARLVSHSCLSSFTAPCGSRAGQCSKVWLTCYLWEQKVMWAFSSELWWSKCSFEAPRWKLQPDFGKKTMSFVTISATVAGQRWIWTFEIHLCPHCLHEMLWQFTVSVHITRLLKDAVVIYSSWLLLIRELAGHSGSLAKGRLALLPCLCHCHSKSVAALVEGAVAKLPLFWAPRLELLSGCRCRARLEKLNTNLCTTFF